jgi:hypothetical protein
MSDWIDKFKLGKSAFIKRDLRLLPLTEALCMRWMEPNQPLES